MRKQQSILLIIKDGCTIDFERFALKTARGVINVYKRSVSLWYDSEAEMFFRHYQTADTIKIIATPDGDTKEHTLAEYTPAEFFKTIGYNCSIH